MNIKRPIYKIQDLFETIMKNKIFGEYNVGVGANL